MKLLSLLFGTSLILAPVVAQAGSIEGVDQDTYNRHTEILRQGRMEMKYEKHHDFYYDYKNSNMDKDSYDCLDDDDYNDSDYKEDKVIKGAF